MENNQTYTFKTEEPSFIDLFRPSYWKKRKEDDKKYVNNLAYVATESIMIAHFARNFTNLFKSKMPELCPDTFTEEDMKNLQQSYEAARKRFFYEAEMNATKTHLFATQKSWNPLAKCVGLLFKLHIYTLKIHEENYGDEQEKHDISEIKRLENKNELSKTKSGKKVFRKDLSIAFNEIFNDAADKYEINDEKERTVFLLLSMGYMITSVLKTMPEGYISDKSKQVYQGLVSCIEKLYKEVPSSYQEAREKAAEEYVNNSINFGNFFQIFSDRIEEIKNRKTAEEVKYYFLMLVASSSSVAKNQFRDAATQLYPKKMVRENLQTMDEIQKKVNLEASSQTLRFAVKFMAHDTVNSSANSGSIAGFIRGVEENEALWDERRKEVEENQTRLEKDIKSSVCPEEVNCEGLSKSAKNKVFKGITGLYVGQFMITAAIEFAKKQGLTTSVYHNSLITLDKLAKDIDPKLMDVKNAARYQAEEIVQKNIKGLTR